MNFFLDIEAIQPSNEMISIGVVCENGEKFYSLIKPQLSQINGYISELTHITQKDLDAAPNIDEVMEGLSEWLQLQEQRSIDRYFYSYGSDIYFFRASLPTVKSNDAFRLMATIMARLVDYSKYVFSFFHNSARLVDVYNFVNQCEHKQVHNALDDAKMLQNVFHYVQTHEPLKVNPFLKHAEDISEFNKPHGTFYARRGKKSKSEIPFKDIDEAVDWVISTQVHPTQQENVHRNRMMIKIMRAIRAKTSYCDFYWRREKDKE